MSKSFETLLTLLRSGLDGTAAVIPADTDWAELYALARRQTVQGVVFDAVKRLPPETAAPGWINQVWREEEKAIESTYELIKATVARQNDFWAAHGIEARLLKGLESASYYPVPEHRINGDIDWWIKGENGFEKAVELLGNNVECETDSDGDVHFNDGEVLTELHRKGLEAEGPVGILLLLNSHVLHHALVFGVGLRQICDYHMALRHFDGQYDKDDYRRELKKRHLLKWTEVLETLPKKFLEMVEADGNFGLEKKRRMKGFGRKALFFAKVAPGQFADRWWNLFIGRIKRK